MDVHGQLVAVVAAAQSPAGALGSAARVIAESLIADACSIFVRRKEAELERRAHIAPELAPAAAAAGSSLASSDLIRAAFATFGDVEDVHVALDRETGQPRGFAFVTMGSAQAAQSTIAKMNGVSLDGRALRVNEAEDRPRGGGGGGRGRAGRPGGNRR
jgi:RNA recognition motif-containing protein